MADNYIDRFMLAPLNRKDLDALLVEYLSCSGNKKDELKKTILKHNLLIIVKEANRHCFDKGKLDDYISTGLITFNRCIDKFDPSKGFAFTTFLTRCMYTDMLSYAKKSTLVSSPKDFTKMTSICSDSETVLKLMSVEPKVGVVMMKDLYPLLDDDRLVYILKEYSKGRGSTDICKDLGISQQRVSQLRTRAIKILQEKVG